MHSSKHRTFIIHSRYLLLYSTITTIHMRQETGFGPMVLQTSKYLVNAHLLHSDKRKQNSRHHARLGYNGDVPNSIKFEAEMKCRIKQYC